MVIEAVISIDPAKRILWATCREWEPCHQKLVAQARNPSKALRTYMEWLEYQISANKLWSHTTKRYTEATE
jgi:hypothetical protein